jgi:hypothetical protein
VTPFAARGEQRVSELRASTFISAFARAASVKPQHPVKPRSTVGPIERAIDTLNEGLSVKRLREKADSPTRERPLLDSRIWKGGNEDDRRSTIFGGQSTL